MPSRKAGFSVITSELKLGSVAAEDPALTQDPAYRIHTTTVVCRSTLAPRESKYPPISFLPSLIRPLTVPSGRSSNSSPCGCTREVRKLKHLELFWQTLPQSFSGSASRPELPQVSAESPLVARSGPPPGSIPLEPRGRRRTQMVYAPRAATHREHPGTHTAPLHPGYLPCRPPHLSFLHESSAGWMSCRPMSTRPDCGDHRAPPKRP